MSNYQQGNSKPIPIGQFSPDEPYYKPGIILDAQNAVPTTGGFKPLPSLASIGNQLPQRPLGSFQAYYQDETTDLYAAADNGSTQIIFYKLVTGAWTAIGGPFSYTGRFVNFSQYGDDTLAVAGFAGGVYRCPKGGSFAAIAGSPASPTIIAVASLQALAFVGQVWNSSAIGDDTSWGVSAATLAENGPLLDAPGPVVAAATIFRNVLAFKKNTVFLGQQGAPFGWQWELINSSGTWSDGCVIQGPDFVAYLGTDDFWLTTGYSPQRIPNQIKEWFFKTVNPTYIEYTLGWYDDSNAMLFWHFVSNNAPNPPTCDLFVCYNIRAQKWGVGHQDVSSIPYLGISSAGLPKPTVATANIIFDGNFIPKRYSGTSGGMSLTSGYYGNPARMSQLMKLKAEYNLYPTTERFTPLHTNILGKPDKETEPAVLDPESGWFNCAQYDKWHRWIHSTTGDCEVIAYTPEFRNGGKF